MNTFTFFRADCVNGLKPATRFAALLIAVILLAACGGGGSSGGNVTDGGDASGGSGSTGGARLPAVPSGLVGTVFGGAIFLDWDDVDRADNYTISRSDSISVLTSTATGSAYIDSSVVEGAQYAYSVMACNDIGCSVAATVTVDYSVPSVPSGLVGSASPSGTSLGWDNVDRATFYNIIRSESRSGVVTTTTAVSTYSDSTVSVGNQYTYSVMACNRVGCSTAVTVAIDYVVPVLPGGSLTSAYDVTDHGTLELEGARSVTTAVVGGITYLFAAGYSDAGVSVFSVNADGSVTNVDNVADSSTLELDGAYSVTTAVVGGITYLFAAGFYDDGVSVFRVDADGSLTSVYDVTDGGSLELDGAVSVTTAVVGGVTYLFAAGIIDDGVSVFRVNAAGSLTNVDNVTDGGDLELNGARSVTTAVVGGNTYLFVAGYSDDGVSVFRVNADGSVTNVDNVADNDDLELDGAWSVTTAVVGGITYLFVAGFHDDGVSVFSVNADGSLTSAYDVTDGGDLELFGAYSVTTAVVGSNTYLFVAGGRDDGVSVFSVNADGSLTSAYDVTDHGTLELEGAWSVTTAEVGGITYLFVAGGVDDGVSVFSVTPPPLITWSVVGNAQILLDWDDVAFAEYYTVRRDGVLLTSSDTLIESSFVDSDLVLGRSYSYEVKACNQVGCSVASAAVVVDYSSPAVPSGLVGTVFGGAIFLDWDDVDSADNYTISRSDSISVLISTTAGSAYIDPSVVEGAQYVYNVMACNGLGCSASVNVTVDYFIPSVPSGLVGAASASEIFLDWDDVDRTTSYTISRSNRSGGVVATITAAGSTYSDSTVSSGNQYTYSVMACNRVGCSTAATVTVDYSVPAVPSGLVGTVLGGIILLDWDDVDRVTYYKISRLGLDGFATTAAVSSYSDSTVSVGNQYAYSVMACNDIGCSVAATVTVDYSVPAVPSGLVGAASPSEIFLDWDDVDSADNYTISRSDSTSVLISTAAVSSYSDSTVSVGNQYAYSVVACNDIGCSAAATVTIDYSVPSVPSGLVGAASPGEIFLDWDDVDRATSYTISISNRSSDVVTTTTAAGSDYSDSTVSLGNQYIYNVMACNRVGCSTAATVVVDYSVPAVPSGLVWAVLGGEIFLDWDDVDRVTSYTISRSNRSGGVVATITAAGSTYSDSTVSSGNQYTYSVMACNRVGCSTAATVVVAYGDTDGDTIFDYEDVDDDGDGLIEIYDAAQLNMMRYNLGGTGLDADNSDNDNTTGGNSMGCGNGSSITTCNGYEQMADIDLNDLPKDYTGSNWEPVGFCTGMLDEFNRVIIECAANVFSGIFSGNNFTISNLLINVTTERYGIGFFGAIDRTAQVHNVHIRGGNITAATSQLVGGLVGRGDGAIISNSSVTLGSISGTRGVGGLVGWGDGASISSSVATVGSVSGENRVGGLVGYGSRSAIISSSVATVDSVSGRDEVGGLVGYGRGATISSSVATVDSVSGRDDVGGLVGYGRGATISSSVATVGAVSGTRYVGGLVGWGGDATISSSVATVGSISGELIVGGLVGGGDGATISFSYWDDRVVGSDGQQLADNGIGSSQTTAALQTPTIFTGAGNIYANWANAYCSPTTGEYSDTAPTPIGDYVRVWDLGTSSQYPAITCVGSFFSLADQRAATARVVAGLSPIQ